MLLVHTKVQKIKRIIFELTNLQCYRVDEEIIAQCASRAGRRVVGDRNCSRTSGYYRAAQLEGTVRPAFYLKG